MVLHDMFTICILFSLYVKLKKGFVSYFALWYTFWINRLLFSVIHFLASLRSLLNPEVARHTKSLRLKFMFLPRMKVDVIQLSFPTTDLSFIWEPLMLLGKLSCQRMWRWWCPVTMWLLLLNWYQQSLLNPVSIAFQYLSLDETLLLDVVWRCFLCPYR